MAKQKMKVFPVFLGVAIVAALVLLGWMAFAPVEQSSTVPGITEEQAQAGTTSALIGKPATADSRAVDRGNSNTQVAGTLYFILNPTVGEDEISGSFASDATTMSASARTSTTSGVTVGTPFVAIATDATYMGFPSVKKNVGRLADGTYQQSELVDLDVYTIATSSQITVTDEDDNLLTDGGGVNLTLAANEAETLGEIKYKVNQSNVAVNLAGFFFDKAANTNVSSVKKSEGYAGSPSFSESSLNLAYTEADDTIFEFNAPILIKEQGSITITDGLTVTAKADGCSDEDLTLYFFDKVWQRSNKADKMIYSAESDADTELDAGMTNPSFTIKCNDA